MTDHSALFPAYEMNAFKRPEWFYRYGLSRYKPLVTMLRASWEHWAETDADGLSHLSPFVMMFNAPPTSIKKQAGGHIWREIRTASVKTNVNRATLKLVGGWSLEEAMEWPVHERRHALKLLQHSTKSPLLIACRHTRKGERVYDNLLIARDFQRLGGVIDPKWGRKRLNREHDALAVRKAMETSCPIPWAKAWYNDIDGFTFSLLKSEIELAIEGASQRHCCRSYANACREGRETVFSIMGPERATMSWNSRYQDLQVKAFANRAVQPATRDAAMKCINKYLINQIGGQ
ncbi:PcfJ domain-containing protein [Tropicibacter sp. R16_0]|uniref:PcfJ domain-containing protein n=1 Tax=Tropicibacter sp. R16_0 TaxID=2821102 RepID=UPI001ADCDA53|nr:PcfJ domain-containing protein [Tropicibacter sp. R16_0]MBO9451473.1 PcfJ domain-containing protein [Tropicibacter sp. R16_0]